jgi:glucose/arabinose dehydrogenase
MQPPGPVNPADIAFDEFVRVEHPVDLTFRAGDPALYVVSQDGFVVAVRDGVVDENRVLDISGDITSGGERGLLGLTFSTDGSRAYVDYTNDDGDTEIAEYAVGADGAFDPASKRLLLKIDQPYANHNGGQVRIGPDGMLYIGMGDGGDAGDPQRRALNVGELLGKLLRIDPTPAGDQPYTIPPDNPFVGVDGARPEIWSVGLRNPWRYSFDRETDDLWIADVGQGAWEEIDVGWADEGGGRGVNYGWSAFEGTHRYHDDQPPDGVTPPIHEYEHGSLGCSISGGVRYRGAAIPSLVGSYVYSDYCSGQVRAFPVNPDRTAGDEVTLTTLPTVSEVAQGPDGELFVLSLDGLVYAATPSART